MRFTLLKYLIMFTCVIWSGYTLMDVSQEVQRVERDIKNIERAIESEEERIRVLRAEWAYLNNPERLDAMLAASGLEEGSEPDVEKIVSGDEAIRNIVSPSSVDRDRESRVHSSTSEKPRHISYSASGRGAE